MGCLGSCALTGTGRCEVSKALGCESTAGDRGSSVGACKGMIGDAGGRSGDCGNDDCDDNNSWDDDGCSDDDCDDDDNCDGEGNDGGCGSCRNLLDQLFCSS